MVHKLFYGEDQDQGDGGVIVCGVRKLSGRQHKVALDFLY